MVERLYISPPFGNYLSYKNAISVKGTFTWHRRKGLIYHTLRSLRPVSGGWCNQIGFRNKGIRNVTLNTRNVFSVSAMKKEEWSILLDYLDMVQYTASTQFSSINLELNLSCPNVNSVSLNSSLLSKFLDKFPLLSTKIKPETTMNEIEVLVGTGVKTIHMSNTIGTPKGGISGRQLKDVNLPKVEQAARLSVNIIAGGGIYSPADVIDYRNAGANSFSISSVLISRPWELPAIYSEIRSDDS